MITLPYSCFCNIRVHRFQYGKTVAGDTNTLSVSFEIVVFKTGSSRFEDITIVSDRQGGAYVALQQAWQAVLVKRGEDIMQFIKFEVESAPEGMDVTAIAASVLQSTETLPSSTSQGTDISTSFINLCTIRPCRFEKLASAVRVCFEVEALKTRVSLCIDQITTATIDVANSAWQALAATSKLNKVVAFVREETTKPTLGEAFVADLFNAAVVVGQSATLSATSLALLDDTLRRSVLIERQENTLAIVAGDVNLPLSVKIEPTDDNRTIKLGDLQLHADDARKLEVVSLPDAPQDHQGILVEPPLWVNTIRSDGTLVIDAPQLILPGGVSIGGGNGGSFGNTINVGTPNGDSAGLVVLGPPPLKRAITWYKSDANTEGVQLANTSEESYWKAEGGHFRIAGEGLDWGMRITQDGGLQLFVKQDGLPPKVVTTFYPTS